MTVESIPKFTGPAAKLWAKVPAHAKKLLLSNVWCGHAVTITDFAGTVGCARRARQFVRDPWPLFEKHQSAECETTLGSKSSQPPGFDGVVKAVFF